MVHQAPDGQRPRGPVLSPSHGTPASCLQNPGGWGRAPAIIPLSTHETCRRPRKRANPPSVFRLCPAGSSATAALSCNRPPMPSSRSTSQEPDYPLAIAVAMPRTVRRHGVANWALTAAPIARRHESTLRRRASNLLIPILGGPKNGPYSGAQPEVAAGRLMPLRACVHLQSHICLTRDWYLGKLRVWQVTPNPPPEAPR